MYVAVININASPPLTFSHTVSNDWFGPPLKEFFNRISLLCYSSDIYNKISSCLIYIFEVYLDGGTVVKVAGRVGVGMSVYSQF